MKTKDHKKCSLDHKEIKKVFELHKYMSYEYYLDDSHPFDDWMWKMFNIYGEKALEEFERYIFLFPDYKSSYHI